MLALLNLNKECEQWKDQMTIKMNYFKLLYFKQTILLGDTITIPFHHCLCLSQDFTLHIFHSFFPLDASNGSSRQDESIYTYATLLTFF